MHEDTRIFKYINIIHDVDVEIAGGGQDSGNSEFGIFMSWNPYKIENHNTHWSLRKDHGDLWWFMVIYCDLWWFIFWLVVSTPLKNMKVSWDDDIPNIWKKSCSKPPTSPKYNIICMRNVKDFEGITGQWKNTSWDTCHEWKESIPSPNIHRPCSEYMGFILTQNLVSGFNPSEKY